MDEKTYIEVNPQLVKQEKSLSHFDLAQFKQVSEKMIAKNIKNKVSNYWNERSFGHSNVYTDERIQEIIETGTLTQQQEMSNYYFNKDGYYKQIIVYYATLLKYMGLLIPNPSNSQDLSTPHVQKKYNSAIDFIDGLELQSLLTDWSRKILINGSYFGVRLEGKKHGFTVVDLPMSYCSTDYKDWTGNDIISFDVSYFNSIRDEAIRKATLEVYPKCIQKAYRSFQAGKSDTSICVIPSDIGICFSLFDGKPPFLSTIPATIDYDEAIVTNRKKEAEEIRKIIVQKIPHLTDGRLLFEPNEAEEIHNAAVNMMDGNDNTSVLTTYADVEVVSTKTNSERQDDVLTRIEQNIYAQAGVSSQIFASTGGASLETALTNDLAFMMYLANKYSFYFTQLLTREYGNTNIKFKYKILPITYYNTSKYIEDSFKLVGMGYSFLLPALAMGLSQKELCNVKDLENSLLKLDKKLKPLETAYTQSDKTTGKTEDDDKGGRPSLDEKNKADKTVENEDSKNNTGEGGSKE